MTRGFALGFALAATPGPMFFLCLRRGLERGWTGAFLTGLGVATGDGVFAAIAGAGTAAVFAILAGQQRWLEAAGGSVLLVLGISTAFRREQRSSPASGAGERARLYGTSLALTLMNPATIVSFAAAVAVLRPEAIGRDLVLLVSGVFFGSLAWWLILSTAVTLLQGRVGGLPVRVIAVTSGAVIAGFGVTALLAALAAGG